MYFGVIVLTPFIITWNLIFFKERKLKIISLILPSLTLITILIIKPIKIIFESSAWKTQKVIYQNNRIGFNKVEFQMQDIGALGYNKRTVEVFYLTNLFMIISPLEKTINKNTKWIKVNKEINELELKLP